MKTFDLHELILCVTKGLLSQLLCAHNVGMETFELMDWYYVSLCNSVTVWPNDCCTVAGQCDIKQSN